jgi:GH15 family glucan-1,4-alpha-glucosidase
LETAANLAKEFDAPDEASKWQKAAQMFRDNLDKLYDKEEGYFVKGFILKEDGELQIDNSLDISNLYGPFMYSGLDLDDPRIINTAVQVETRLYNSSPIGGVIRYENDGYFLSKTQYKGNPWVVCTAWLAQYHMALGDKEKAKALLDWSTAREMPSGVLSEQYDPEDGSPLGVTPLVWSHAELINTILDIDGTTF